MLLVSSLFCTFVGTVLVIVGLCTNAWIELRDRDLYRNNVMVRFGLHRVCWVSNDRCNNAGNDYDQQSKYRAQSVVSFKIDEDRFCSFFFFFSNVYILVKYFQK